ncbi:hypothetical protein RGQ29_006298 [Quercus rubra]|uniref:CSN8/PSMD8/EIF3K domain-containing protein n=1 Tax=Quercus rubra TaxID=3512 RepID=A0AAN7E6I7_QUERU|nr:hypothetical protein RGQ29_006298 [Quercus rubra]
MDFSPLTVTEALASKSYEKIAHICDHAAAEGVAYEDDWPYYSIHLLARIYCRFLWKSIASTINESQLEVVAIWKIGQKLWTRDYGGGHEAIRGFDWSQEVQCLSFTQRMFQLLLSAYSTISIQDTGLFLGMNDDDATNYVLQQGWVVDPASQMLTVKKQTIVTEQRLDATKLQRLIEYVFHLAH